MFSHLCRACLDHIENPSDAVPLFESYKNISYHRLVNKLGLSLDINDNLATHVCKKCATEVLKSYKFRLMYMQSDQKLRDMLIRTISKEATKEPNKLKNLVDQKTGNTLKTTTLTTSDGKWKCKVCSAGFTSRTRLQHHNKTHRINDKANPDRTIPKQNENRQKLWNCNHCSAVYLNRKLKNQHQQQHHQTSTLNVSVEPSVVIDLEDDDYEYDYNPNAGNAFIQINVDDNSADESDSTTDLSLYLMQKNSQLNCFDPLEGDNSTGSILGHMVGNHSKLKNSSTPKGKWKCDLCSDSFRTPGLLSEHKEWHTKSKIKVTKDEQERKSFADQSSSSDPNLRWKCQTCSGAFSTRELLRIHRRNHFGTKPSPKKPALWAHYILASETLDASFVELFGTNCTNVT